MAPTLPRSKPILGPCLLVNHPVTKYDPENGAILDGVDPAYYGIVVKALLVHRADWGTKGPVLNEFYGPKGQGKYVARKDNIARVLGYGRPHVEEVMTCAANRATLVGFGEVAADRSATLYRVPLPPSLERVTAPRSITMTLAWFSPVNVRHRAYRRAKLELAPADLKANAGVTPGTASAVRQVGTARVPVPRPLRGRQSRGLRRRRTHPIPRLLSGTGRSAQ